MSWAVRRESILANELSLRSQDDESFAWLDTSTFNIFGDEKVTNNLQRTLSPASTISSGPSSANTSPCPLKNDTSCDEDDDSDVGFEDHLNFEPYYVDNDKYSVIDGKAYMVPTIPQPKFTRLQDTLGSMAGTAKDLQQTFPPRPTTPLLPPFQGFQSRSPSPSLPSPGPQSPYDHSQGKRSRSTHATKTYNRNRASLISGEDSDEGESDGNASDDEYIPSPQLNSKKRLRRDSPQLDTWSFGGAQNYSGAVPRTPPPISPLERPTKRVRPTPISRNVQVSSLSEPIDALALSFKCPECGWVQRNKRVPDFRRHVLSHVRPSDGDHSKGWWCKGVLASSIPGFHGEGYQFAGEQRYGGCLKTFSRRDALKRHLDNPNVACLGSVSQWD
ncbi:hypothetical protein EYR40_001267 [Pleurotus pulmonarius]|nr:hypothetical protein EYR38_004506 [Pleurotus pulmonarius]KAF4608914.1 hypothetical protein EYR40_001267 [Pleurotus pulmonarius]